MIFSLRKAPIYLFINCLLLSLLCSCKKDVLQPKQITKISHSAQGDLNKILFLNDSIGYIIGGTRYAAMDFLQTVDGGNTWTLFNKTGEDSKSIFGLCAYGQRAYAVGYEGKIFIKDAVSSPWQRVQTAWWECLQAVTFTEPNTGYIVAGLGYRDGRVFRIDSTGQVLQADSFDYELSAISFASTQIGFAAGYGAVLKTENAGKTWSLLNVQGDFYKAIYCANENEAWIIGFNGSIIHTQDGGRTWEKQRNGDNPLLKPYKLRAIAFKNPTTGYIAGDNGLILKTTDGGKHWVEFEHFTDQDLRCLTFHPDGSLWVAGSAATLYRIEE